MAGGGFGPRQWRRHAACRLALCVRLSRIGGGEAATLYSSCLLDSRLHRTIRSLQGNILYKTVPYRQQSLGR